MDRNMWMNRSRRTTLMGERRSGSSKDKRKNLLKPFGEVSGNKENESRGLRRNVLGAHGPLSKNERQQTKEVSSRRSITRRLSFQKTDMDIADESPLICAGSCHDNYQDVDESMLFPLNSTAVMNSAPSPFRLDLLTKGEQKPGYPFVDKHLNSSKYGSTKGGSDKKVGLSDETKELLRQMGIDTSPDAGTAKQDTSRRVPEKRVEGIKTSDHEVKDAEINVQNQTLEIFGKSAPTAPDCLPNVKVEKKTQTTPKLRSNEIGGELPARNGATSSLVMILEKIHLRHFQEREDLLQKQKKEVDEVFAKFRETNEGVLVEIDEKSSHGDETRTRETQPESLVLGVGNDNAMSNNRIEVPSSLQPPDNVVSSMRNLTAQLNLQKEPFMTLDNEEPPSEIGNILSPQVCILPVGSVLSQTNGNTADTISDNKTFAGANDKPVECSGLLNTQIWQRKQEVSIIETPRAGSWLVEENLSFTSTPTLGLNSMLKGMSIQGQQTFMETPATRRLVTKRILQGVESLFL